MLCNLAVQKGQVLKGQVWAFSGRFRKRKDKFRTSFFQANLANRTKRKGRVSPLFPQFYLISLSFSAYLKYLSSRPLSALPCRASSLAISSELRFAHSGGGDKAAAPPRWRNTDRCFILPQGSKVIIALLCSYFKRKFESTHSTLNQHSINY